MKHLGTLVSPCTVLYFIPAVTAHQCGGSRNLVGGIVFLAPQGSPWPTTALGDPQTQTYRARHHGNHRWLLPRRPGNSRNGMNDGARRRDDRARGLSADDRGGSGRGTGGVRLPLRGVADRPVGCAGETQHRRGVSARQDAVNRSPAAQGPVHRDRSRRCRTRRVRQRRRNQALRQAGRDIAARLHSRRPISGWSSPAPTTGRPPWASASSSVGTSSRRGGRDRAGGRGRRRLIPLAAKDMREGPASLAHTMANRWPRTTRPTRKGRSKRGRLPSDVRQEMRHGR